jgi:hypothetical protein
VPADDHRRRSATPAPATSGKAPGRALGGTSRRAGRTESMLLVSRRAHSAWAFSRSSAPSNTSRPASSGSPPAAPAAPAPRARSAAGRAAPRAPAEPARRWGRAPPDRARGRSRTVMWTTGPWRATCSEIELRAAKARAPNSPGSGAASSPASASQAHLALQHGLGQLVGIGKVGVDQRAAGPHQVADLLHRDRQAPASITSLSATSRICAMRAGALLRLRRSSWASMAAMLSLRQVCQTPSAVERRPVPRSPNRSLLVCV